MHAISVIGELKNSGRECALVRSGERKLSGVPASFQLY